MSRPIGSWVSAIGRPALRVNQISVCSEISKASSTLISVRAEIHVDPVKHDLAGKVDKDKNLRVTLDRARDREFSETCSLGHLGPHRQPFSRATTV